MMTDERLAEIRRSLDAGEYTFRDYYGILYGHAMDLLAEVDRLRDQTQWRPIETAPKDKVVLLWEDCYPVKPVGRQVAAYWSEEYGTWQEIETEYPIDDATHWRPHGDPPEVKA